MDRDYFTGWRRVAIVIVTSAFAFAACGNGDEGGGGHGDGDGDTALSAQDVSDIIENGASEWLSGFTGPSALNCPGTTNTVLEPSDSLVRGCAYVDSASSFHVLVQNLSTVPVSVWGRTGIDPIYTVAPDGVIDLVLTDPQFGRHLSYQVDEVAGLTAVVVDEVKSELNEQRMPGYNWLSCAARPDADCLLSGLAGLLPEEVTIEGRRIPLRLLGEGLALAYANRDLLSTFASDLGGQTPGQLTLKPA